MPSKRDYDLARAFGLFCEQQGDDVDGEAIIHELAAAFAVVRRQTADAMLDGVKDDLVRQCGLTGSEARIAQAIIDLIRQTGHAMLREN